MVEKIKNYYENYDEEGRLFRDNAHKVEYLTSIRYFDKLFPKNSRILDTCAGAGRYSFYLADKGHDVTACDLVEHNLNIIKSNPAAEKLSEISACNVLDLSRFRDNSFDIVLCMGALYHLWEESERRQAITECVRVCKTGGIVVFAYILRNGAVLANINEDASNIDLLVSSLDYPDQGVFVCLNVDDVVNSTLNCGLEKIVNISTDCMVYAVADKLNAASNINFQKYMDYFYSICEDPSLIGVGIHGLLFCKKI